ncbi:hypothetical protein MMC25_007752 [Agyrium rufum]|nr:hypothetical protein [Agyrium rufum]
MDPISIIGAITVTIQTISEIQTRYTDAPRILSSLQYQCRIFEKSIRQIHFWMLHTPVESAVKEDILANLGDAMSVVWDALNRLNDQLNRTLTRKESSFSLGGRSLTFGSSGDSGASKWVKTKFVMSTADLKASLTELRECSALLQLTLSVSQLQTPEETGRHLEEVAIGASTLRRAHTFRQPLRIEQKPDASEQFQGFLQQLTSAEQDYESSTTPSVESLMSETTVFAEDGGSGPLLLREVPEEEEERPPLPVRPSAPPVIATMAAEHVSADRGPLPESDGSLLSTETTSSTAPQPTTPVLSQFSIPAPPNPPTFLEDSIVAQSVSSPDTQSLNDVARSGTSASQRTMLPDYQTDLDVESHRSSRYASTIFSTSTTMSDDTVATARPFSFAPGNNELENTDSNETADSTPRAASLMSLSNASTSHTSPSLSPSLNFWSTKRKPLRDSCGKGKSVSRSDSSSKGTAQSLGDHTFTVSMPKAEDSQESFSGVITDGFSQHPEIQQVSKHNVSQAHLSGEVDGPPAYEPSSNSTPVVTGSTPFLNDEKQVLIEEYFPGSPTLSDSHPSLIRSTTDSQLNALVPFSPNSERSLSAMQPHSRSNSIAKTPLHIATEASDRDTVLRHLKQKANPNAIDSFRMTPLHIGAANGDVEICDILLSHGAQADVRDLESKTAVQLAAEGGHVEVVELLCRRSTLKVTDHGSLAAFFTAVESGQTKVAESFLNQGLTFKSLKSDSYKPITLAAKSGNLAMLDLMIERKCKVKDKSPEGWTALHFAARQGHVAIVQRLLEKDLSRKAQTGQKETPLHLAVKASQAPAVEALLREKSSAISTSDATGQEPLHHALRIGNPSIVSTLLTKKAPLDTKNDFGWKPIHVAVAYGHLNLLQDILAKDASKGDISVEDKIEHADDKKQNTHAAVEAGYIAEARWPYTGSRPLHLACEFGREDIVRFLLSRGAKVDATCNEGWRPLHHASFNALPRIVSMLLAAGAHVHAVTNADETSLALVHAREIRNDLPSPSLSPSSATLSPQQSFISGGASPGVGAGAGATAGSNVSEVMHVGVPVADRYATQIMLQEAMQRKGKQKLDGLRGVLKIFGKTGRDKEAVIRAVVLSASVVGDGAATAGVSRGRGGSL